MARRQDVTDEWKKCESSKRYKTQVNLYENCDKNERFYSNDQWNGVQANGLPTPVFNIFKRVINYFISAIMSQRVKMRFTPENIGDDPQELTEKKAVLMAEILSKYADTLWEKLKMDSHMRDALLDAALSGDMDGYIWFDPSVHTGQFIDAGIPDEPPTEIMGELQFEMVDNVNVHFGNPNDVRIESQPWIILSFRELTKKLRTEAKKNEVKDWENIVSDSDYTQQSGDLGKIELDAGDEDGKTTTLLNFWRADDGNIWFRKSTKAVVITEDIDTGVTRYPIAHNNWGRRKNSCHGEAVGTGLIPNQIFINKMFAMVMLNLMNVAFPKAIYNQSIIQTWSNQIGQAIPVQSAEDINKVAAYLQPGNMSSQVMNVIDAAIGYTKDLLGATDAALGNIKPDNTSAIIAVQQASFTPLETIKANLYQWVEDIGYIFLDMMIAKYGQRYIIINDKGKRSAVLFNFDELAGIKMQLKVDVGPSSFWSEISAMQTLDHLLESAKIDFVQYLERVPDGMIPKKDDLLEEIKARMAAPPEIKSPPPSVSVSYKDLPIPGQIQLAEQLGVKLTEQDFQVMDFIQGIMNQQKQAMAAQGQQMTGELAQY